MKILGDGKAIIRMDTNKAVKQEKYFLKEARCRRHSASFLPYGKKQLPHCGGGEVKQAYFYWDMLLVSLSLMSRK